jgi:hypothetical protein
MHQAAGQLVVSSQAPTGSLVSVCMQETIRDTLATLEGLATPVVRTCHVGNVGSNNFGWLTLVRNTYLGPMDHTLYGVDDIYMPWVLLGDYGRVEACYDLTGRPHPDRIGRHANDLRGLVARRHSSLFSFGIFAEHEGEDLVARHVRATERLSRELRGLDVTSRSAEILGMRPLLEPLVRHFFARRLLHLLFHKWVRTTRAGYAAMLRIKEIRYEGGEDLSILTTDSSLSFRGTLDDLLEALFSGVAAVDGRLRTGRRFTSLAYPWISTCFNLVMNAVKESARDADQRVFWHAVAATNHLYAHQAWFQEELALLFDALARGGFLPQDAELRLIPTYACQLFATTEESRAELERLVAFWRDHLRRAAEPAFLRELAARLAAFNELDPNRLPVAYEVGSNHPAYNKYGIAQRSLLGRSLLFPAGFSDLRWGEAELLVKTLGRLTMEDRR